MFYEDHEKMIYTPLGADKKYDPLAVHRKLIQATQNKFDELWATWCSPNSDLGDISKPMDEKIIESLDAEEGLVKAARVAFELPPFPECLDAVALEYLRDFVGWMEGKGQRVANT